MATLVPIPTTRVSTSFVRQRLLAQLQGDQLDVFRLQNQISTGRRISLPSEDAPAAQRAITLQRLIERKTQLSSNVDAGKSFLSATDVALADVATALGNIRGVALGAAGTTTSDEEREVARAEVEQAINQLLTVANTRFRGRYLFAGSQTNVEPYARVGNSVKYFGNEKLIQNFSDLDVLFATNAPGANVFGGISDEVISGIDLKPQLSADTLLSSLRGGRGISPNGALQISDGSNSVVIDVSRAVTMGDVIRLIEENPPAGRTVSASISATGAAQGRGLTLQLDSSGGGNLTVKEVGSGKAASELGILNETGVLTNQLVGGDLEPSLLKTVRVDSLLGTKARARLISAGSNNDLLIEASVNGAALPPPSNAPLNGVTVQFVTDASPGAEVANYAAGTLTIHIASGASTANAVASAINAEGTFTARIDPTDTANPAQAGAAAVTETATAVTAGGSGTTLDLASGIRVQNGGQSHTLDFSDAKTVEDILNVFNGSDAALYAAINADGTGIDVRSRLSGSDFQIGENGGETATQLGLRTFTRDVRLDDLNHGVGVPTSDDANITITSSQLAITARNGTVYHVDLFAATTVADAIAAINLVTTANVTAQPADGGNGIRLVDNTLGSASLTVAQSGTAIPVVGGVATHIESPDFTITTRSGQSYNIDVSGAANIGDVIDKINAVTVGNVTAELAESGNGIQLTDNSLGPPGPLTLAVADGSQAAEYLGFVPRGSTQVSSAAGILVGTDQNSLEPASVFSTLARLADALATGDINAMERAISQIDEDIRRTTFARSEVGAREQALDLTQKNLQDEDVLLQSALSGEVDVDLVEAISNLTARQVSLQASLQTMGNILQLSLLDYL